MARKLKVEFIDALQNGLLKPFLDRVHTDQGLCLEIRKDAINLYYRGGNLLKIRHIDPRYEAHFDPKYMSRKYGGPVGLVLPPALLKDSLTVEAWLTALPRMKGAMDGWFAEHPKEEREVQQRILRENNIGTVAGSTDYFICDIEYAVGKSRFDMVAVHWPSSSSSRKRTTGLRLAFVEVKYGDSALKGTAGLLKHVDDVCEFASISNNVDALKAEMVESFRQKQLLGLVKVKKAIDHFDTDKPELLFILANHDPASTILGETLAELAKRPPCPHIDIRFAASCFMGYGLYDEAILGLGEFQRQHAHRIGGKSGGKHS